MVDRLPAATGDDDLGSRIFGDDNATGQAECHCQGKKGK